MTRDEAYRVLGLSPGAGKDEIAAAYRELAQMLHPDKYGDNKRLRRRAEQQMRSVNEARDILLKGARPTEAVPSRSASDATRIAREAQARASAAETARLSVVSELRTMRERRRTMASMAAVAAIVALVCSRMRGGIGLLASSLASAVALWGIVDAVLLSSQVEALRKRSRELLRTRDAAQKIADEASRL